MAETTGGPHSTPGAWVTVFLIVAGCTAGCLGLILHSVVLWIVCGVLLVAGGVGALATNIMEQAH